MKYKLYFIFLNFLISNSQTINLNESHLMDFFRTSQLNGEFNTDVSFTLRPLHIGKGGLEINQEKCI